MNGLSEIYMSEGRSKILVCTSEKHTIKNNLGGNCAELGNTHVCYLFITRRNIYLLNVKVGNNNSKLDTFSSCTICVDLLGYSGITNEQSV